jgi:hypothetical protein
MHMMIDRSVMQKAIPYPAGWMIGLVGAILAATVLKTGILAVQAVPFNADEAVVALMARHILQGERPLFFYGQAYMGSLDAYLVAAIFKLFGSQVWGIRLVQILLYAGTLLTTAWLGKSISGKWQVGVMAAWLLAVPTVSMTLYSTVSMGGYGEMLLLGNLILLLTVSLDRDANRQKSRKRSLMWLGLGLLSGLGLWVFGLTLVYSVPAVAYLAGRSIRSKSLVSKSARANPVLEKETRSDAPLWESLWVRIGNWGLLLVGVMIGALPWLVFAIKKGFSILLVELGGGAIAGVESVNLAGQILRHVLNLGLFGTTVILGLRPSWEIRWLGLPLAPLVLSFWGLVIVYAVKKTIKDLRSGADSRDYSFSPLLSGVVVILSLGFIFSPFGADPSGRYFLPISLVMSLFAAQAVWTWQVKWGNTMVLAVCLVIIFNLWGTIQSIRNSPPGVTTQIDAVTQIDHSYDQELIGFLRSQGEEFGYTNYWVAYPIAFLSNEDLVFVPRLPYHPDLRYTSRDDRYEPYQQSVAEAAQAAYITTNNPLLDDKLRTGFSRLGVEWYEIVIGDYQVYYGLSEKVEPGQIGLGADEG